MVANLYDEIGMCLYNTPLRVRFRGEPSCFLSSKNTFSYESNSYELVKYYSTDSHEIVSEQKGLLSPVTNPYRLLLWCLITNERNTKIGAEQCAKDTTLGEIILSVFENGVGATELHFT